MSEKLVDRVLYVSDRYPSLTFRLDETSYTIKNHQLFVAEKTQIEQLDKHIEETCLGSMLRKIDKKAEEDALLAKLKLSEQRSGAVKGGIDSTSQQSQAKILAESNAKIAASPEAAEILEKELSQDALNISHQTLKTSESKTSKTSVKEKKS